MKSLEKKRLELVNLSKNIVKEYGWNDSLFENISFHNRISYDELIILFPDGYKEMLKLSLDYLNYELENICSQYDFIRIPIHKRIKKIIITKINLMNKHKDFYKIYTSSFKKNNSFSFFRTDNSFHGVETVQEQPIERKLIQYSIMVNGS